MNARTVLVSVAVLGLLGVAGWLGGFFEAGKQDGFDRDPKPRPGTPGETDAPEPVGPIGRVETARYTELNLPERRPEGGEPGTEASVELAVTGRVLAATGPVGDAEVTLMVDNGTGPTVHQLGKTLGRVKTLPDGSFSFPDPPRERRLALRVTHPAYCMGRVYGLDAARPETLHQVVNLVTGQVVSGRVTDVSGRPLDGVAVSVFDMNLQVYEPDDAVERTVVTGGDGTFSMNGVGEGIKRLEASREGYATAALSGVSVPQRSTGLTLTMDFGLSVEGYVVVAGKEEPVPGARIVAQAGNVSLDSQHPRVLSTRAGEDGRFSLKGLRRGTYTLWARNEEHARLSSARISVEGGSTGVRLEVPVGASVSGQVIDRSNGLPVPGFDVFVTGNPDVVMSSVGTHQRVKNPEGRFAFAGLLPMKLYIVCRAPGFAEGVAGPFPLGAAQDLADVVVEMDTGVSLSGTVTDQAGAPLEGVLVRAKRTMVAADDPASAFMSAFQDANAPIVTTTSNGNGEYVLTGLREGTWDLQAEHGLFMPDRQYRVVLQGDRSQNGPAMVLTRAGGVMGTVRLPDGRPDGAARVTLRHLSDVRHNFTVGTGPDGRFEKLGIPPGVYAIQVIQRAGVVDLGSLLGGARTGERAATYEVLAGRLLEVDL